MTAFSKIALIVDGLRIGKLFAPRLAKKGYQCIHVLSNANAPEFLLKDFQPEAYLDAFVYDGNIDYLIQQLKKYSIQFVLPGYEGAVELADLISEKLNLFSNGTALSEARRNKYKMIEAVKNDGLTTVDQIRSNQLVDIQLWAKNLNKWPVVLKPLKSAGSDLVFFCENKHEIDAAFNKIIIAKNVFGEKNIAVLAQSFLKGTEYIVNTISLNGQHFLTDLWVYKKQRMQGAGLVYDEVRILPYDFGNKKTLVDYAFKVLDALGIKYGAAHVEIMVADESPKLVEIGARCMGAISPDVITQSIGRNQVDLLLDSYVNPQKFLKDITQPYHIKKYLLVKFLISYQSGMIQSIQGLDKIKKLDSFYQISLNVKEGGNLKRTVDLGSSPGMIVMLNADAKQLEKDHHTVSQLEKEMFLTK